MILHQQAVNLAPGDTQIIGPLALPAKASDINLFVDLPRSDSAAVQWDAATRLQMELIIDADGDRSSLSGGYNGGITLEEPRPGQFRERTQSILGYSPGYGFRGAKAGKPKMWGEERGSYTVTIVLSANGPISSLATIAVEVGDAPDIEYHASISTPPQWSKSQRSYNNEDDPQLTYSFTANAGTNRLAFVSSWMHHGGAGYHPTAGSMTYGGTTITSLWSALHGGSNIQWHQGGYVIDSVIGSGAKNVVVSYVTDGLGTGEISLAITVWEGVDQGDPVGTPVKNDGSSTTPNVTISAPAAGNYLVDSVASYYTAGSEPTADQTEAGKDYTTFTNFFWGQSYKTGSANMGWSKNGTQEWGDAAVEIKAAAGGISIPAIDTSTVTEFQAVNVKLQPKKFNFQALQKRWKRKRGLLVPVWM